MVLVGAFLVAAAEPAGASVPTCFGNAATIVEMLGRARETLAIYRKNQDLINIGAYPAGSNAVIDKAIRLQGPITQFLRQPLGQSSATEESWKKLQGALQDTEPPRRTDADKGARLIR
jgi:hypothetical protein